MSPFFNYVNELRYKLINAHEFIKGEGKKRISLPHSFQALYYAEIKNSSLMNTNRAA